MKLNNRECFASYGGLFSGVASAAKTLGGSASSLAGLSKTLGASASFGKNLGNLSGSLGKNLASTLPGATKTLGDSLPGAAKSLDGLGGVAKNADSLGGVAKNADSLGGAAKSADSVGGAAKSADSVGGAAKSADSVGGSSKIADDLEAATKGNKSLLNNAGDIMKQAGSSVAKFAKNHPILVGLGLTAAGVGIYAAVKGISFDQATEQLANKTTEEITQIVKGVGGAAAQIISEGVAPAVTNVASAAGGAVGGAVGGAAGNLIGSTLDGILNPLAKSLGITKTQLLYIIAGIVIFFVLIWLYRTFSSSGYDYDNKYLSFGDVNLSNLEYLGKSMN